MYDLNVQHFSPTLGLRLYCVFQCLNLCPLRLSALWRLFMSSETPYEAKALSVLAISNETPLVKM